MFALVVVMMISNNINSCDAIFPCTVARKRLTDLFQRFEKKTFPYIQLLFKNWQ